MAPAAPVFIHTYHLYVAAAQAASRWEQHAAAAVAAVRAAQTSLEAVLKEFTVEQKHPLQTQLRWCQLSMGH